MSEKKPILQPLKTEKLSVLLTKSEARILADAAALDGIKKSTALRKMAFGSLGNFVDVSRFTEQIQRTNQELSRIGNNLNQIARMLNSGEQVTLDTIDNCLREVCEIVEIAHQQILQSKRELMR